MIRALSRTFKVGPSDTGPVTRAILLILVLAIAACGMTQRHPTPTLLGFPPIDQPESGCWYDNDRFVFVQASFRFPGSSLSHDVLGVYVINVASQPFVPEKLDLQPIPEPLPERTVVSCQNGELVIRLPGSKPDLFKLYSMHIGGKPELVSELRGSEISLKGKYVIGSNKIIDEGAQIGTDSCGIKYLKPGFEVLCWNAWLERHWPQAQFVVGEYKWDPTVKNPVPGGAPRFIPNPKTPLLFIPDESSSADSTGLTASVRGPIQRPETYALVLYDFKGAILRRIDKDPSFSIDSLRIAINSDAPDFVYAPCARKQLSPYTPPFDSVCRRALRDSEERWELVVHVDKSPKLFIHGNISLSTAGVAFEVGGAFQGIWVYDWHQLARITGQVGLVDDSAPAISPDGQFLAFQRPDGGVKKLWLIQYREQSK